MPHAFVVCQSDAKRLGSLTGFQFDEATLFCSVPADLDKLQAASEVWFVVSQTSLLSTQFQEVVLTALSAWGNVAGSVAKDAKCWLLPLEEVVIPLGFSVLNALPIYPPE